MNREDALAGDLFHYGNCTRSTGPRGGIKTHITECRRNGANKTWKTRPDDFRVPIKSGFRDHGEIVPANVAEFHRPEDCPLLDGADHSKNETHIARVQPVTYGMLGPDRKFYRAICTCGFKSPESMFAGPAYMAKVGHEAQARGCLIITAVE